MFFIPNLHKRTKALLQRFIVTVTEHNSRMIPNFYVTSALRYSRGNLHNRLMKCMHHAASKQLGVHTPHSVEVSLPC
jgi:hypothetical protein